MGALDLPNVEPIAVDATTECHITPALVASRMAEYLDIPAGRILEPSAGTGALVAALLEKGHPAEQIVAIERHSSLKSALLRRLEGEPVEIICGDFLEYAKGARVNFSGVLMNPPFRKVRQHVDAALSLLYSGGALVALVPDTFQHDAAEEIETLPNDIFALAKVRTKIVRINR
ncbi:hypothetical protein [Microbulbifer discodermiae]|uniref:hypothetical protein n=1 Tax=Microbulbifer sp. 2201CG32-9 TaxID=3232309 RepID=UPI00345B8D5A